MLAFGAVPIAAGMIRNAQSATGIAAFDMTTQVSRTTVQQIRYDFTMFRP
jgi:hypothetical protein